MPQGNGRYALRWFTPSVEVDLCGHATLASGFVILSFVEPALPSVEFETISGQLSVTRSEELLSMDFPSRKPEPAVAPPLLSQALGETPLEVLSSRDLMAVFKDEDTIKEMKPDFEKLKQLRDVFGVIVTARGKKYDFVSRYFAPGIGVPEDPVTGSAHCTLVPYWSEKLGKEYLRAYQLSKRGGEIFCRYQGKRVKISGKVTLYAKGEIWL